MVPGINPERVAERLPLVPLAEAVAVWSKLPEVVPYLNPADVGVADAPEKEPDRVAPVELTPLGVLAVVTDAVGCCPPAPPPDWFQLL